MATHHDRITPEQQALIAESKVFFVGSAHPRGEAGPEGGSVVLVSLQAFVQRVFEVAALTTVFRICESADEV